MDLVNRSRIRVAMDRVIKQSQGQSVLGNTRTATKRQNLPFKQMRETTQRRVKELEMWQPQEPDL